MNYPIQILIVILGTVDSLSKGITPSLGEYHACHDHAVVDAPVGAERHGGLCGAGLRVQLQRGRQAPGGEVVPERRPGAHLPVDPGAEPAVRVGARPGQAQHGLHSVAVQPAHALQGAQPHEAHHRAQRKVLVSRRLHGQPGRRGPGHGRVRPSAQFRLQLHQDVFRGGEFHVRGGRRLPHAQDHAAAGGHAGAEPGVGRQDGDHLAAGRLLRPGVQGDPRLGADRGAHRLRVRPLHPRHRLREPEEDTLFPRYAPHVSTHFKLSLDSYQILKAAHCKTSSNQKSDLQTTVVD
ncbi:uncharacterized protein CEXT_309681 [Caerostris extrusa]|uniref:Uncharacterized protein n=1 Tax=Caerostris extrusa TaxID=172846 RepID=A0AAV4NF54_CAEEX|nr:uncharacterized protein CEXT_309681 [Caerostris extrusa]